MKKIKITFNISEDVVEILEKRIPKRKRNTFIEEAIHARFSLMEQEKYMRELIMDNKARDEALELIDEGLEQEEDTLFKSDDLLNEDEISELDEFV